MLVDEARLEVVGREKRVGSAAVGQYFSNYEATDDWLLEPGFVEGRRCALVFDRQDPSGPPRYFILLEFADDSVVDIRDFRYAAYVMADARWERLPPPDDGQQPS